jgi:hypothetical protein
MSDRRTEFAKREAEAWATFDAELARIPRERWEETGVLDGWTLKEMLWHVAGWLERCANGFEATIRGEETSSDGLSVDERNVALADAARSMAPDAVWAGLLAARDRVLAGWERLPELDKRSAENFEGETFDHYPDHLADLAAFLPDAAG